MRQFLVLLLCAVPAAAQTARVAPVRVPTAPGLAYGAAAAASLSLRPALSLPTALPLAPSLGASVLPAPSLIPSLPTAALPAALVPEAARALPAVAAAPAAVAPAQAAAGTPGALPAGESVRALSESVAELSRPGASPSEVRGSLDTLFSGAKAPANAAASERGVVNDEGVEIFGRPPAYYLEAKRLEAKYKGKVDLSESLDVMDDAYADAWTKLAAIEGLAEAGRVSDHNTRLYGTLMWLDGVLERGGKRTAVNAYRVYFHKAPNPRSEIEEGLRRADAYLKQVLEYMRPGGKVERAVGTVDQVVLAFETRGYDEIKQALREREKEIRRQTRGRVRFAFVDELARVPQGPEATRAELNRLVKRYGTKVEGLSKIIEGVVYSRYVGLLLELKTVEHFYEKGWRILQSGRDFFDADGKYVTELDTVVQDPATGRVSVVEAKSARVDIPPEEALNEKVIRKLEVYAKHRALLEKTIGQKVSEIVFSFDVGMNKALVSYLTAREAELSKRYGFSVKFLFLSSAPEGAGRGPRR